jgi:hypothetical protein
MNAATMHDYPAQFRDRSDRSVTLLEVFEARCQARALLYQNGELTLHESVDALQTAAVAGGLVNKIGQDAVQALMAKAFSKARANG